MKNRDFKGIWIPREIWLSSDLTLQEKIFFIEIDSLDNETGCFAGNAYFAEFFNISKTRVSLIIKSLIDKNYITSTIIYKEGTKQILKRVLKICYIPYLTKVKDPIQGKLKDNNTVNNTINNTTNKVEGFISDLNFSNPDKKQIFLEWLNYRSEIKKPIKVISTLESLSKRFDSEDINKCKKVVSNSIENNWQGLFWDKVSNDENGAKPFNGFSL